MRSVKIFFPTKQQKYPQNVVLRLVEITLYSWYNFYLVNITVNVKSKRKYQFQFATKNINIQTSNKEGNAGETRALPERILLSYHYVAVVKF